MTIEESALLNVTHLVFYFRHFDRFRTVLLLNFLTTNLVDCTVLTIAVARRLVIVETYI